MQDTDVVPTRSIRASSLASLGRWSNANKRSAGESGVAGEKSSAEAGDTVFICDCFDRCLCV